MLDYFLKNEFIEEVLSTLLSLNRDEYYINMAVAWALATAYVNFKDKVNPVLENKVLPAWVHNKTIQKYVNHTEYAMMIKIFKNS